MEKGLQKVLDEVLSKPGVTGVLCADENGLCLGSKGVADTSISGSMVNISHLASKLEPNEIPIVRLESESKEILIRNSSGFTLAIMKKK